MASVQAQLQLANSKLAAATIVSYCKSWTAMSHFLLNNKLLINTDNKRTLCLVVAFNLWEGSFGMIRVRITSVIGDHSDHARSNESKNPCPEWIHQFIWSHHDPSDLGLLMLIWVISKECILCFQMLGFTFSTLSVCVWNWSKHIS